MLNYIDNYKYSKADENTLDQQLSELRQLLTSNNADSFALYSQIRQKIYKEIKIEQLAITRILNDLIEVKTQSQPCFIVLLAFTANPLLSYKEIADQLGITKQRVYYVVSEYAKRYKWLENLLKIKGCQDAKNENNRSVFYKPLNKKIASKVGKKCFIEQMELFK